MPLNTENSCHVWENVCKLAAGLKRQADSPNDRPNVDKIYVSDVCQLAAIGFENVRSFRRAIRNQSTTRFGSDNL